MGWCNREPRWAWYLEEQSGGQWPDARGMQPGDDLIQHPLTMCIHDQIDRATRELYEQIRESAQHAEFIRTIEDSPTARLGGATAARAGDARSLLCAPSAHGRGRETGYFDLAAELGMAGRSGLTCPALLR